MGWDRNGCYSDGTHPVRMTVGDHYRTLSGTGSSIHRDKGSKFIGLAFPIVDGTNFKQRLASVMKEHAGAQHFCYAYVLGPDADIHRANDAGEPSGTAGAPILRSIRSAGITFSAVVVVRYFGGTLLGKPGLISAYGIAASAAILCASVVVRIQHVQFHFTCAYPRFEVLKREIRNMDGEIIESAFTSVCSGLASVPRSNLRIAMDRCRDLGVVISDDQSVK